MWSYSFLLGFLIVFLMIIPQLERSIVGGFIMQVGLTVLYINCLLATLQKRLVFRIGVGIGVAAVLLTWISLLLHASADSSETSVLQLRVMILDYFVQVLFFLMMAAMILINVLKKHIASVKSVIGAICGYLLLGLAWAMMYRTIELIDFDPLSIENRFVAMEVAGHKLSAFSQLVYFSFVTMSTLGYGDISPRTPAAQTLTWSQAVLGQFYIAVLVAWLVSSLPKNRQLREE